MQLDSGPVRVASSARADPIQRAQMAVLRGEHPRTPGARGRQRSTARAGVTETFKVTEAGLDELNHYELTNAQGEVIDSGMTR